MLLSLVSGCGMLKAAKYIRRGSVSKSAFKTEVAFEMRFGLIVLKVMIHGKEYSFILDTGAPNVISKELALQLGIEVAGSGKARDSQGNTASLGFAAIDSIGIGDLQFLNTGAMIADLRQSAEVACFHVDGLIGANLMRKALWQFDYERHVITITNDRDSLAIPSNAKTLKFHPSRIGIPLIDVMLNGQSDHNVTVDLGSNGDFCSSVATLKMLKKSGLHTNTYSYGFGTSGLYGRGQEDTTWYAVVPSLCLDSMTLPNQIVSFSEKGAKTIGTNFLKNFRLIFDWSSNELTMIPISPYDNIHGKMFNSTLVLRDHQVFIGSVISRGDVAFEGPQLGDQVVEVDGKDYRNCSDENWCAVLSKRFENSTGAISIIVKRGDRELKFKVAKESLFEK